MPLNRMSLDPLSPGSEHICMSQGWSDDERAEVVWPPAGADPPAGTMPASGGCASVDVGLSQGPEPHLSVDLYVLVLPSTAVTKQVITHAVTTHVFQQWFNKLYAIEGQVRPAAQPWPWDYPSNPPEMEVASEK